MIGSGSAPLSAAMVVGWKERFGIDVTNFFGSNEGTGLVGDPATVPDPEERARYFPRFGAPGTDGEAWGNRAARGTETKLVDPLTGEEVTEPDVAAELAFRGPTRFPGYWRRPEMTARAIDADGYYHTGDLFEIAGERGDRLRFIGRARDLIIRGGMKVAPEELEALVSRHPAVAEVAVVGVEDRRMEGEQRICVAVVVKPDATLSIGELRRWLGDQQIAAYKMPKELLVLDSLPRNPLGKVLKRDLRMRFEGRGADPSVREESGEAEEATPALSLPLLVPFAGAAIIAARRPAGRAPASVCCGDGNRSDRRSTPAAFTPRYLLSQQTAGNQTRTMASAAGSRPLASVRSAVRVPMGKPSSAISAAARSTRRFRSEARTTTMTRSIRMSRALSRIERI